MAQKYLTHLDLNGNEIQNVVLQRLSSNPSSPTTGQIYYNTSANIVRFYDGSQWVDLPGTGGGGGTVTSVAISGTDGVEVDSGSPITSSGTITLGLSNTVLGQLADAATAVQPGDDVSDLNNDAGYITGVDWGDIGGTLSDQTDLQNSLDTKADITYVQGLVQGLSWKQPARVATTANVNLDNALENGDTIDGVTLVTGDRVLVKNQSDQTQNGIYIVAASGAASRSDDANTGEELRFATIGVEEGTVNANTVFTQTTDDITIGSSNIVFVRFNTIEVPNATTDIAGKVELATEAETIARSDTTRAVTPSGLASFPRKYAANIGDNSNTSIAVTHNLGTEDVIVQVYENATGETVECDVERDTTNQITLSFTVAPTTDELRVVVIG